MNIIIYYNLPEHISDRPYGLERDSYYVDANVFKLLTDFDIDAPRIDEQSLQNGTFL